MLLKCSGVHPFASITIERAITFNTISCLRSNIGRAVFMNTFFWHFLVKILEVMLELILENKFKTPLFITFILYLIEKFNYTVKAGYNEPVCTEIWLY